MYCTYCGHQNVEGNKFCEACGKPLAVTPVAPPSQPQVTPVTPVLPEPAKPGRPSWLRRLPSIGGAIVVVCFFLPWMLVSCSVTMGGSLSGSAITGYEIATGNYSALQSLRGLGPLFGGRGTPQAEANPLLFLIPMLGFIGLVSLNGRLSGTISAMLSGMLGIAGIVIFSLGALALQSQFAQVGFRLQLREGYWGTWIGFIWQTTAAIMTVKLKQKA